MEDAFASSKLVVNKRSTSLTPWSVYSTSTLESQKALNIEDDLDTIEKDLPRLTPRSLQIKRLGEMADALHAGKDWEVTVASLRKILYAFVVRHSNIGYAQGMHTNVLYLLIRCAGDEEAAFWAFCALVEDARPKDFYAKPPAAMNGYLIDSQVLVKLMRIALPKAPEYLPEMVVPMLAPKLLIPALVDQVPIATLNEIYDCVYSGKHMLLLPTLTVLVAAYAVVKKDVEAIEEDVTKVYAALEDGCSAVTPEQYYDAFELVSSALEEVDLPSLRLSVASELSERWYANCPFLLKKLSNQVHFDVSELSDLQQRFREMKKKGLGIDREGLSHFLSRAATPSRRASEKISPEITDRIFELFDDDHNGEIDFREVVCCLSVLTRGSTEERLKLLFDIFDADESGFLEGKEIAALAGAVMKGAPEGQAEAFRRKVELTMDANNDGEISFQEFSSAVQADPIMMTALGVSERRLSPGGKSPDLLSFACTDGDCPKTSGGGAFQLSEPKTFKLSEPLLPGEGGAGDQSNEDKEGKCCNCCVLL